MRGFAALVLVAAGCLQSSLVPCGDLFCAPGSVCVSDTCASPADVAACDGMTDGASCRAANGGAGTCQGGVCLTGLCGNGHIDVGEACDDGNQVSGDGCRGDCLKIEVCGDGQLDQGEACDDGNHNAADGCDMCVRTVWNATTAVGAEIAATDLAFADPHGLAVDGTGRVFVADTFNHRILRVETDGSITTIAGNGIPGFSGDGGEATSAQLQYPADVAVDGIGRVFIADAQNARIRRIDLDGTMTTIAGTGVGGYAGDGGPAVLAQLANPSAVAVDGLGRVVIADTDNNVIRRIDTDGTIDTIAGTGIAELHRRRRRGDLGHVLGAAGRGGRLDRPRGRRRHRELGDPPDRGQRHDLDGRRHRHERVLGRRRGGDLGEARVPGRHRGRRDRPDLRRRHAEPADPAGHAPAARSPRSRATAPRRTPATVPRPRRPRCRTRSASRSTRRAWLAIADTSNERIRHIDAAGTISSVAGNGTFGFGGDGGMATSAQLGDPFLLATDAMGRVYITDTNNNRIRRVELDGTITTVAGTGLNGFSGDGGPATKAELAKPDGVAIDGTGRIFIADTYNNRIRMVDAAGVITTVAGDGTAAVLQKPNGIAVDGNGGVVIADTYNRRIRRVDLATGTLTTIAGNGSFGYSGDGGPATSATLSFPYGITVDSTGQVIFGDTSNNRVRAFTIGGNISTIAGTGTAGFSGDGGQATAAKIDQPYAVAQDPQGRLLFVDWNNHRVRRIDAGGVITTVVGSGVQGASGDAAAATSAQLDFPIGVAVDANGLISIADTNNERVRRVDPTTGIITTIAGKIDPDGTGPVAKGRLADPQALAVASSLTLVAGGTSGTLEAIRGGTVSVVAGRYPEGTATGTLARYRTQAFGSVTGVAIDQSSNLIYFTETSSNRLHVVSEVNPADPSTWTIATLANNAGTAGFADGAAATAQFRGPTGLYLDAATHVLYIADTGNHAIRALDLLAHTVATVVNASHSLGFSGDDGVATAAQLFEPTALTRCPNGDLFIADTGNNRIRRVTSGTISTVLGDGVPASSGEGTPARTFPVDQPRGLACDAAGDLFVTSAAVLRLLPANDAGVIDGSGAVQTIYGAPPRTAFPSSVTDCLTGVAVVGPTTLQVADACTGLLVQLDRAAAP